MEEKNQYELLVERLRYCAEERGGCGVCEYSETGCNRKELIMASIEAVESFIHPESSGIYDLEEIHENVTVEVWKNSITGECSVGWYDGRFEEDSPDAP